MLLGSRNCFVSLLQGKSKDDEKQGKMGKGQLLVAMLGTVMKQNIQHSVWVIQGNTLACLNCCRSTRAVAVVSLPLHVLPLNSRISACSFPGLRWRQRQDTSTDRPGQSWTTGTIFHPQPGKSLVWSIYKYSLYKFARTHAFTAAKWKQTGHHRCLWAGFTSWIEV